MKHRDIFGQQTEETDINMTPMLDIVFIMLIFFIVSTSFVRESGIEVNRPTAATGKSQHKNSIMVAINQNNDIWIDRRLVDLHMVRPVIERIKYEQSQINVVVQADEEVTSGHLISLLDQLRMANVKYSVATQSE